MARFDDKVVLMQVFAAWCATCITEARNIQQVRNQFSEKDLEIVFFDVQQGETKEQIEDFMLFSSILGLKPAIALRFNYEGWLFIDPKHLKDTGKNWAVSLKTAKEKGQLFSQFFER